MSNVLLLNQYYTVENDSQELILASLPLNLLNLGSYLNSKGVTCDVEDLGMFDFNDWIRDGNRKRCGKSNSQIKKIVLEKKPILIGLSCMYSRHFQDIVNLATFIKKINPKIKIVTGGNHASSFAKWIAGMGIFDYVVVGEGEETLLELSQHLIDKKQDVSEIKGLVYKKGKKIIENQRRLLIWDLNKLPPLDYSLVDVKKYAALSKESVYLMRTPVLGIMSSRGCPGDCVFCTVRAVWGKTWRGKNAVVTVDEIELLHKTYGINEISFLDDSAAVNKKRWGEICDEIIRRKLDIKWTTPNGIAHWTLDKRLIKKMKKAGCYRITFGIESGNQDIRKYIHKTHSLTQAVNLIRYANKIGMWTICTHILGFPYETKEQIMDTINFAKHSGTDFAAFFTLNPQPTSLVYEDFKKEGLLNFDDIFKTKTFNQKKYQEMYKMLNEEAAPTTHFNKDEIKKFHLYAYRSFIAYRAISYLNPIRILNKINNLEDFRYTAKLIYTGLKLFIRSFVKTTTKSILYSPVSKKRVPA